MSKILLVEDDNNLREIYGARLGAEGYEIITASDGEEALAISVKQKPDLIITDVMMPRISGFDMLDILRNAPETKNTKVIMMTALSQAEDKARAEKLGADMYLVKSQVTLEDVAKAVKNVLDPDSADEEEESQPPADDNAPGANQPPANEEKEPATPPEQPTATPAVIDTAQTAQPTPASQPTAPVETPAAQASTPQPSPTDDSNASPATDDSASPTLPDQSTAASLPTPAAPPTPPSSPAPTPQPEPETPTAPDEPVQQSNPTTADPAAQPLASPPATPAVEPQTAPSAQSPPANQATAPTTAIKVELPGSDNDASATPAPEEVKKNDKIDSSDSRFNAPPVEPPKQNAGPNLSDILAQEAKSAGGQTNDPVTLPPPDPASPSQPANTPQPTPPPQPDPSPPAAKSPEPPAAQEAPPKTVIKTEAGADRLQKKVIQPSEEFLKGGSKIEELLAKETADEAAQPPQPDTVIKSPDQTSNQSASSSQDFNKIAL